MWSIKTTGELVVSAIILGLILHFTGVGLSTYVYRLMPVFGVILAVSAVLTIGYFVGGKIFGENFGKVFQLTGLVGIVGTIWYFLG